MKSVLLLIISVLGLQLLGSSQQRFDVQVRDFFLGIPIDTSFEKLTEYAVKSGFTYIEEYGNPSTFFYSGIPKAKLTNERLRSSSMDIHNSDSLFVGDSIYLNSFSIEYWMHFYNFKSMIRVYDNLVSKLLTVCDSCKTLPLKDETYGKGIKFYRPDSMIPSLIIDYFARKDLTGCTITILYLRQK